MATANDNQYTSGQVENRTFDPTNNAIQVIQATSGASSSQVQGNIANGVADAGNPIKTGGKAATAQPTAVTNLQRVDAMFDKVGRQVMTLIQARELYAQSNTVITSSAAETTIIAAGGAGVFNDISAMFITNTSAVATQIDFRDVTAGTIRFSVWSPANSTTPVNPITYITQTTANNVWTAQCSSATSTVSIFAQVVKNI
jgi:hypothetical protein